MVVGFPKINILNRNLKERRFLHQAWMKGISHSLKNVKQKAQGHEKWEENQEKHLFKENQEKHLFKKHTKEGVD